MYSQIFLSPTAMVKSGWLSKSLLKPEACCKDICVLCFKQLWEHHLPILGGLILPIVRAWLS